MSDTTGTLGTYSLTGFGSGSYTITPSKTGGVNGSIGSFDAAKIAQFVTSGNGLSAAQQTVADVSATGGISSFDAALIARFVASLGSPTGSTGNWIFSPAGNTHPSIDGDITEDYSALLMGEVSGNWTSTGARLADGMQLTGAVGSGDEGGPTRSIAVNVPSLAMSPEKEIVVPVAIEGAADKGIISYEFDLRYDAAVVQPVDDAVDVAGTVSRGLVVVTNVLEPGRLRVVMYGPMPIDENGLLLNLKFTAVGKAGSVSPLAFERLVFNEGEPMVSVTDGQIELF